MYLSKLGYSNLKRGYLREGSLRGAVKRVLHKGLINQYEGKEFLQFLALLFFFHYDNCATNNL